MCYNSMKKSLLKKLGIAILVGSLANSVYGNLSPNYRNLKDIDEAPSLPADFVDTSLEALNGNVDENRPVLIHVREDTINKDGSIRVEYKLKEIVPSDYKTK